MPLVEETTVMRPHSRHAALWNPALPAVAFAALLLAAGPAAAAEQRVGEEARVRLDLTVYNQDLALIGEARRIVLGQGENTLAFEGVSPALRPETVLLHGTGLRLLEQSFAFDLITPRRLLEASVGRDVRLVRVHPQTGEETMVDARVLSVAEGPVLRIGDSIETDVPGRIVFDRVPDGVRERPTLLATIDSATAGEAEVHLSYLSGGLSWRADYVAELNAAEDRLALTGLVTLSNTSGTTFRDANLRLVAGVVNVATPSPLRAPMEFRAKMEMAAAAPMPAPQAAGDLYVYPIARPITVANQETKQVVLLAAQDVAVRKVYRFETWAGDESGGGDTEPRNAAVTLEMDNKTDSGLGMPLPAGIVRIYRAAPGGSLFAGEDGIRHTAAGERVKLTLGSAFDVTGEATQTAFERISNRSFETAQTITLRNAKADAVEVQVVGNLPPGWRMLEESAPHAPETASRIVWTVRVPAKGSANLSYRIRVNY
jgi:hypothetical protein